MVSCACRYLGNLVSACSEMTEVLLRACPTLRILTTSREPLGIPGEVVWDVPSLSVPDQSRAPSPEQLKGFDGVRLFVERAAASRPGFAVTAGNAAAITQVCSQLEGIPLALELAAARVKVLTVEQIAGRLDDRFRLLTGGRRTALPRHQTLGAAIDWSYNLLSQAERVMLQRLSVFAGGWTLEAAGTVCAGGTVEAAIILDLLTSLVDKSLVLAQIGNGLARYRLLETVRQYGRERLAQAAEAIEVRNRHQAWCVALAEQAEGQIRGPYQRDWLERLEAEHDNLRAALTWSREDSKGADAMLRITGALLWFWWLRGYLSEARGWYEEALKHRGDASSVLLPKIYEGLMHYSWRLGNDERAKVLGEEGLAIARQLNDKRSSAYLLANLGIVASRLKALPEAAELYGEAMSLAREIGDKWLESVILSQQGQAARAQGLGDQATSLSEQALALMREVGDDAMVAYTHRCLGRLVLPSDYQRAAGYFMDALRSSRDIQFRWIIYESLVGVVGVSAVGRDYCRAARLYGAAEGLRDAIGWRPGPYDQAEDNQGLASTQSAMGESAFAAAWAEGGAMTLEHAIEYALAEKTD
jgi:predicted ATPase